MGVRCREDTEHDVPKYIFKKRPNPKKDQRKLVIIQNAIDPNRSNRQKQQHWQQRNTSSSRRQKKASVFFQFLFSVSPQKSSFPPTVIKTQIVIRADREPVRIHSGMKRTRTQTHGGCTGLDITQIRLSIIWTLNPGCISVLRNRVDPQRSGDKTLHPDSI